MSATASLAHDPRGVRATAKRVRRLRRSEPWVLRFLGIAGLCLLWQVGSMMLTDNTFISSPSLVVAAARSQIASGQLASDTLVTLSELAPGFLMAIAVGVPLGMAMGRYRFVDYIADPYLWFFYSAPIIAFYPLLIMWLGLGTRTIIALTFLFAIFPVVANTVTGVREVDRVLIRAARSFGAGEFQVFMLVILPASVPAIAAGLRLGIGRALIGAVVGEFFGANSGLGYRIAVFGTEMRIGDMFVPVIVVMVIGVALLQLLQWLESLVDTWRA